MAKKILLNCVYEEKVSHILSFVIQIKYNL